MSAEFPSTCKKNHGKHDSLAQKSHFHEIFRAFRAFRGQKWVAGDPSAPSFFGHFVV
jgi:hypothetical protein